MTNLQASLGLSQLNSLNTILIKKRKIFNYYKTKINKNKNFSIIYDKRYVNWVFALKLKKKIYLIRLKRFLTKKIFN